MKLQVINDCYRVLETMKHKKMPASMGFILYQNVKKLIPVVEDIEKSRMNLVNKYAVKDESGNPTIKDNRYVLTDEMAFNVELDELFNAEINIDFDKISMGDIKRCDEEKFDALTLEEIAVLQDFMVEEPEAIDS